MSRRVFPFARATALIDTAALARNYRLLAARADGMPLIAVVKANAYGHGAALTVPALWRAGCRHFAVATLTEAREVRKLAPSAGILILGYTDPCAAALLARERLVQTVFSAPYAAELAACARQAGVCVRVHLKADGGMCRLGFPMGDAGAILRAAAREGLCATGLYTHFPCADADPAATAAVLDAFCALRAHLAERGLALPAHAHASAALLTLPRAGLSFARPGLALYGVSPVETDLPLTPALSLSTSVIDLHRVPTGTPVGYGGAFRAERPSLIGTLPVGYADGFPRAAEGFSVTLCHKSETFSVPVVGHICMDQCMVDLTGTPAARYDRVELWRDPRPLAAHCGTIPYDILTALSPRVARREKEV